MKDQVNENSKKILKDSAVAFGCVNCGNQLSYDPESGKLFCRYCKTYEEFEVIETEAPEYVYYPETDDFSAPSWDDDGLVPFTCPSCGAEILVSPSAITTKCPYCEGNYVTKLEDDVPYIKPETLIPFRISEQKANELYLNWAKRRFWAPRKFKKDPAKSDALSGTYLPFWTFDTDLTTDFSGFGGRKRLVTYTTRENGKTVTKTKTVIDWYPVGGTKSELFDDVPCCATARVDRDLLKKLGSFSMKTLNVYNPAFLAGFFAERYSIGLKEGFESIVGVVHRQMENLIERELGYDTYRGMHYSHRFNSVKFKHILLPVWMSAYKYKDKIYNFMVNGETGRVAGRSPVSALKVTLFALGCAAIAAFFLWIMSR